MVADIHPHRESEQAYWLFQFNTRDPTDHIRPGYSQRWQARKEMQVGDGVVLWKPGEGAGVFGLGKLLSDPANRPFLGRKPSVEWRCTRRSSSVFLREKLRRNAQLRKLLAVRGVLHAGVEPVSKAQWLAVCALWQKNDELVPEPVTPLVPEPIVAKGSDEHDVWFREKKLVAIYAEYAKRCGLRFERERDLTPKGGSSALKCDLYEKSKGIVIEAKGNASRESVRMAIGELFDYRQFILPLPKLAVLLPKRPAKDLVRLLSGLDIQLVWQTADMAFRDNAGGLLSKLSRR